MKKIKLVLIIYVLVWNFSCENIFDDEYNNKLLSKEEIADNLAKKGKNSADLLVGEWRLIKFAFTSDGKKISKEISVSQRTILKVPSEFIFTNDEFDETVWWSIGVINTCWFFCSIEENLIKMESKKASLVYVEPPHLEFGVFNALSEAYSYIIRGDELLIHYSFIEDEHKLSTYPLLKNKNLLIFKKIKK